MSRRKNKICLAVGMILSLTVSLGAYGQENVFELLKSDMRLADEYYREKNYQKALQLYWNLHKNDPETEDLNIKIARCYYFLKEYRKSASVYEALKQSNKKLPHLDLYYLAEVQASAGNYVKAIETYREYLKTDPGDTTVAQKIWRLSNVAYLYEDSLHYAVRPVSINTEAGEICPRWYKDGIMFLSNRKATQVIEKLDQSNGAFYKTYFSKASPDSLRENILSYKKPVLVEGEIASKLHCGPMAFYENGRKMVFASSGKSENESQPRTLQLYFAEERNGNWETVQSFAGNSNDYSVTDPTITADGMELYFSSDMKGGFGGNDIYRCVFRDGAWTKPVNLGWQVNTPYNEVSPFIQRGNTLYFSSDGHPGLGGLDIFKVQLHDGEWGEVMNLGYPINTAADEFGVIIDSLSTHGYFSSNRKRAGFDDDLYEFDIDLQHYPLTVAGLIHTKENILTDSLQLQPFAHAKILLIDNIRHVTVYETLTDDDGNFSIVVPYFSKFRITVTGADGHEHVVSLEISKNRKMNTRHEIVIVKDYFQPETQNKK
jgi:tetratricopeptide (TPR) repeat protein